MKSIGIRFLGIIAFALMCMAVFPQFAQAKPHITFHADHVYLNDVGRATVTGYFRNSGDKAAYVEWTEFDLEITDKQGNIIWNGVAIRHYPKNIRVPSKTSIPYTFYIKSKKLPRYKKPYSWRTSNERTHWNINAG
ncbi:MAG: hypothetical protein K6C05_02615 [Anaerovibrio sp.]|uniref:hypothetical protein n=1 Tax=Anaerovibrio sp. TaxID=1872532 RepID=UPI0025CED45E|nr:hypothetical protein [Anaerovibrio sp.]MCR5175723.1 hypothetical protein [Anaerovibrio sp.]